MLLYLDEEYSVGHDPNTLPTEFLTALVKSWPPMPPMPRLQPAAFCAHRCFASRSLEQIGVVSQGRSDECMERNEKNGEIVPS